MAFMDGQGQDQDKGQNRTQQKIVNEKINFLRFSPLITSMHMYMT